MSGRRKAPGGSSRGSSGSKRGGSKRDKGKANNRNSMRSTSSKSSRASTGSRRGGGGSARKGGSSKPPTPGAPKPGHEAAFKPDKQRMSLNSEIVKFNARKSLRKSLTLDKSMPILPGMIKAGQLSQKSGMGWKRRYVELKDGDGLVVYDKAGDTKPKEKHDSKKVTKCETVAPTQVKGMNNAFTVVVGGKQLFFAAATAADAQAWVQAIKG